MEIEETFEDEMQEDLKEQDFINLIIGDLFE